MSARATEAAADAMAEGVRRACAWNEANPIGTPVTAYPATRDDEGLVTRTRSLAWNLGHGEPVVQVEGYAGGISLDHVDVIAEPWMPNGGHEDSCGYVGGITRRCTCGGAR